ncbi:MAG: tRNA lysidine(34) synthetase TilS, partial [Winogradskyella sp.]
GKYVLSNTHRLIKHRDYLILTDKPLETPKCIQILNTDKTVETPLGNLSFSVVPSINETSKHIIYVDKETLSFPLEFRVWQEGDRFQPLGMTGKKKVSKYLKDEKLSLPEKEQTFLLMSNNTVVWVAGKRADHRFKVTEATKEILQIELK